jgi:hypothetical protein
MVDLQGAQNVEIKIHFYGISQLKLHTFKLYLYGKYSTQTMIFWFLCAFIWFKNMKKMLLQMTSVSLQPVPSLYVHVELIISRSNNFIFWLYNYVLQICSDMQVNTVHVGLSIAKSHYVG